MRSTMLIAVILALGVTIFTPESLLAHGLGARYAVPIPLSFFIFGGAVTIMVSFLMVGMLLKGVVESLSYPRLSLISNNRTWLTIIRPITWVIHVGAVLVFLLLLSSSLLGTTRGVENFAPTFVWVIWWVGFGFVVALIGNVWELTNPWKIIFGWFENIYKVTNRGERLAAISDYPNRWSLWPALIMFIIFAWIETSFMESSNQRALGFLVILYSIYTFIGMFIFGKYMWLRNCEVFSVVFDLLSRFSIFEVSQNQKGVCKSCGSEECKESQSECVNCYECMYFSDSKHLNIRPPAVGLNISGTVRPSVLAMIMMLLASVTFDGFSATPEWSAIQGFFIILFPNLTSPFINGITIANTLGLIISFAAFLSVYKIVSVFIANVVLDRPYSPDYVMRSFVFTLIPIALAYNYAHFLAYLLIQGQQIIPLVSDPFGFDWDIFGTADYLININVTNARFIWFFSVIAIVVGHVIAVYLSHVKALAMYKDSSQALRSQIPMLVLMVIYTVVSLWIISRPITE